MRNKSIGTEMFFNSVGANFSKWVSTALRIWRSHIHRDADTPRASQWFNAGSNVYSVAINIAAAMHNVANMNADFNFNAAIGWNIGIAVRQRALNRNRALGGFQGTLKLD
jgi:hypothetical protein